jgi:hypothetical protein
MVCHDNLKIRTQLLNNLQGEPINPHYCFAIFALKGLHAAVAILISREIDLGGLIDEKEAWHRPSLVHKPLVQGKMRDESDVAAVLCSQDAPVSCGLLGPFEASALPQLSPAPQTVAWIVLSLKWPVKLLWGVQTGILGILASRCLSLDQRVERFSVLPNACFLHVRSPDDPTLEPQPLLSDL